MPRACCIYTHIEQLLRLHQCCPVCSFRISFMISLQETSTLLHQGLPILSSPILLSDYPHKLLYSLSYCRSSPQLSPTSSAVQPGHLSCNTLYLQPHKTYFTHTTASVGINVILITYLVTPITLITNNIVPYPAWQRWQDSEGKR